MNLSELPRWTAILFVLYAMGCLFVAVRASYIPKLAARMRPSARQRLLARPAYVWFVRLIGLFGFIAALGVAIIILRS